jgi:hypothetical protein
VQAQPNLNLTGSPHPTYFLAYGNYMPGQVIDVSEINKPVELLYPTGVYSLETTLNADNSWTPPTPVSSANAQRLKLLSR